jgi:hypothetical protein
MSELPFHRPPRRYFLIPRPPRGAGWRECVFTSVPANSSVPRVEIENYVRAALPRAQMLELPARPPAAQDVGRNLSPNVRWDRG